MNARTVSILAGIFLLVMGAFLAGMWTTYKDWAPWRVLLEAKQAARALSETGVAMRSLTYVRRHPNAADQRYTVSDPTALADGLLLIGRIDPETSQPIAELLNADGSVAHRWQIDYGRLVEGGRADEFPHGMTMLADGSLLVNFDTGRALARIDACSEPAWVNSELVYHHVISKGEGGYWTWGEPTTDIGHNQFLVRFNPETGEVLEKISLLDDVIPATASRGMTFGIPDGYKIEREADPDTVADILHPNDIEELLPEMAASFPQFRAGDLLISMRNINLVAVIDRQTHQVKWAQYGPWRDQHDPDFEPDGRISVFSNNLDRNRSSIILIDPKTNQWRDPYQDTDFWFNSFIMGKQQRLPNGNRLIASAMEGRVLEVAPTGKIVREFSNILNDRHNSVLNSAELVPHGFLRDLPDCEK